MADRLFLSLEAPPSLIFDCLPRRPWPWRISRQSSSRIRIAVPELRGSSRLPLLLAHSTLPPKSSSSSSPSPPTDSSPAKFDIVSSIQLSDGSYVFRFGDTSEMKKNLGTEETVNSVGVQDKQTEIVEEAGGISVEQGGKNCGRPEGVDGLFELEVPNDKSNGKREGTSVITETVNHDAETVLQEEDTVASTNRINVIKIKDRRRARSPRKKKKETLNPMNVSKHNDEVEAKHARVSNLNSEESSTMGNSIASGEEKVAISEESEKTNECEIAVESSSLELCSQTCDYPEVTEKAIEGEIRAKSPSLNLSSKTHDYTEKKDMESEIRSKSSSSELCSENHDPQEVTLKKIGIEVMQVSTVEHGGDLDVPENAMINVIAEEKLFVEPMATAAVSQDEPISVAEATRVAETSVAHTSDADARSDDGENEASTSKEEITAVDTKNDDDVQVSAPKMTELKSIETASGRDDIATREFYLDSGVAVLQHPSKALAGREDAYFFTNQNWLGVADGVSQWSFEGINPGTYAQELLSNCEKIVLDNESVRVPDPVEVLSRSVGETKSPGSSTALLAYFDDQALHVANIGDSGFMVIRNGTVLQKSSPIVHEFGFPLQIMQGDDPLKLGEMYHVNLDEGDIIITATDGLFDNLYEKEITSMVSRSLQQNLELQKIAELLATKAQEVGHSASARTPFSDAAQAAGYAGHRGGKLDAVTIIVSLLIAKDCRRGHHQEYG